MTKSLSAPFIKAPGQQGLIDDILKGNPPRATSFIVTIYGDVVEPRGGVLWMGNLIECCARHGISESLVRTAVWRLVSAGRLEGQRIGRKSFYSLSAAARTEFRRASDILFAPPPPPEGWLIAVSPGEAPLDAAWVPLGGAAILAPERDDIAMPSGPIMAARTISAARGVAAFAMQKWPLMEVATTYQHFVERYDALRQTQDTETLPDAHALALRLRLVDDYRQAALADPRLPVEALPDNWPARAAREVFRDIYLALSPAAERHIATHFSDSDGKLAMTTPETLVRAKALRSGL